MQFTALWLKLIQNNKVANTMLAATVLFVFSPILQKDFSSWDDGWMLYGNDQIFSLSFDNIRDYFSSFYHGQYSPVNTLLYGLIYHFFGLEPFWFHLFSLLLHIANVLLVFTFVKRLLWLVSKSETLAIVNQKDIVIISFFAALLFGAHPMQVETVAWISASKILLYSFLSLLALINYLRYIQNNKMSNYYIIIILFIISFGAKEQTVILPCCFCLIDYFLKRDFFSKNVFVEKIPFFVISLMMGFVGLLAQDSGFHDRLENNYYPVWQRIFLASFGLIEYIIKMLMPINLAKFYNFPMEVGKPFPIKYWFYPILVVGFGAYLYRCFLHDRRCIIFGLMFFFINIFLALHIIPMARRAFIADRYIYLGSIGIFFLLMILIANIFNNISFLKRRILLISCILYLFSLMTYTAAYAYNWM